MSPEENEGNEHRGGIKVKMKTSGPHLDQAVKISGEGADGDQRIHGGRTIEQRRKPPFQDGQPGPEKYEGCHHKDGVRKSPENGLRKIEKPVKEDRGHHDVGSKKSRDAKGQYSITFLFLSLFLAGNGQPISEPPDARDDLCGGNDVGKICEMQTVGDEGDLNI